MLDNVTRRQEQCVFESKLREPRDTALSAWESARCAAEG